jgi:GT2 family glycosyltransferase
MDDWARALWARLRPIWKSAVVQFERPQQWLVARQQVTFFAAGVVIVILLLVFSGVTAAVAAVAAWIARRTRDTVTWTGRIVHNLTGSCSCALESARGANMSFRAEVSQEIGEFDPGYTGTAFLEETDFATRMRAAGWILMFSPQRLPLAFLGTSGRRAGRSSSG